MSFIRKLFGWLGSSGAETEAASSHGSLENHLKALEKAEEETNLALSKVLSFGTKLAVTSEKMEELSVQINDLATFLLQENTLRAAREINTPKPSLPPPSERKIRCLICEKEGIIVERYTLKRHLDVAHGLGTVTYMKQFPGAKVVSDYHRERCIAIHRKRLQGKK